MRQHTNERGGAEFNTSIRRLTSPDTTYGSGGSAVYPRSGVSSKQRMTVTELGQKKTLPALPAAKSGAGSGPV